MLIRQCFALLFCAFLLTGCVSNHSAESFARVKADIDERSGYAAEWTPPPAEVDKLIRDSLEDGQLDAEEAVRLALANNADLQAELDELGIAHARLIQASLLPNPVLDVGVRFVEAGGGEILELGVAQNLVNALLLPRRKALAEDAVAMAERRAAAAVLDLAAQTRTAYRRYQAQLARIELYQSVVDATSLSADMARRLREAGNVIELKALREDALYQQSRLMLAEAQARAMRQRESLNALLGLWGQSAAGWSVEGRLPDPEALELDPAKLASGAVGASLDLELQRLAIDAAAKRAGIKKREQLFPDVEAGVSAEREPDGTWSVGPHVGVALPVFDLGQGVRAEEAARLRQAMNRYTGLAVRLRASARSAYTSAQTAANTTRFLREKLLPLQTEVTQQTQLQFNAMQIGVFELLSAKRSEIQTAERYLAALEEHWVARIHLETLRMGRLPQARFGIEAGAPSAGAGDMSLNNTNNSGGH